MAPPHWRQGKGDVATWILLVGNQVVTNQGLMGKAREPDMTMPPRLSMLRCAVVAAAGILLALSFAPPLRAQEGLRTPAPAARLQSAAKPASKADSEPVLLDAKELAEGWISLFDGQTLFGWKAGSKADWRVDDGTIRVGDLLGVRATPVVRDGRVDLSFSEPSKDEGLQATIDGLVGLGAEMVRDKGLGEAAASQFEGLNRFVENINRAVAGAGQRIVAVQVTPGGVRITTGPVAG